MHVQSSLGQLILVWFMVPFGTLAVAAHTVCQRVEMVLFMPAWGFGMGASVLVGQNLGARQQEQAQKTGWLAAGLVEIFLAVGALVLLLWAEDIVRIFNPSVEFNVIASTYLRIAAIGYLVTGLTIVLQNCISGAGDTLLPMLVSLMSIWVLQIPLAFLLPRLTDLGVYGIRWAIVIGVIVGAISYTAYFWAGRWKRKKV